MFKFLKSKKDKKDIKETLKEQTDISTPLIEQHVFYSGSSDEEETVKTSTLKNNNTEIETEVKQHLETNCISEVEKPKRRIVKKVKKVRRKKKEIEEPIVIDNNTVLPISNSPKDKKVVDVIYPPQPKTEEKPKNKEIEDKSMYYKSIVVNHPRLRHINHKVIQYNNNFNEDVDEQINDRNNIGSKDLGEIGEKIVVKMFEKINDRFNLKLEITRISEEKAHYCDVLVFDNENKIVFCIEVKNKTETRSTDRKKFQEDLKTIEKDYPNYFITGLFISLYEEIITENIKEFYFDLKESYIARGVFTQEFMVMYIKSIQNLINLNREKDKMKQNNIQIVDIENQYNYSKILTEEFNEIKSQYNNLNNQINEFQNKICDKFTQDLKAIRNVNDSFDKKLKIKENIVRYCENRDWKESKMILKEIVTLCENTTIFEIQTHLTKKYVIETCQKWKKMYGF